MNSLNADLNAAKNIAAKASINRLNVAIENNLAQAPNYSSKSISYKPTDLTAGS